MGFIPSSTDKPLDEQEIEKEYLRVPRFALRSLGHWPHDKLLSFRVLPLTIVSLTIITLGVAAEVSFSYTHVSNLPLALDALCPALTKGVTVIKFVMLLLTRSEVAKMLNDIKQKWINDKSPESSYENMRATKVAMVAAMILICFSNTASTGYSLRPLGTMIGQYFTGKEIVRALPFKSAYPFDEYADPIYTFTYIFISSTGTICCFGLAGMDGIFVSICLHISAEFRILKRNFEQLTLDHRNAENERTIQYTKAENLELNKKLKALIRRHQETIQMNEHMVQLFFVNIFSHFVSAALVLCCVSVNLLLIIPGLYFHCYYTATYENLIIFANLKMMSTKLLQAKGAEAILYICYGIAALTQLLIYCAGGTILNMASFDINEAAYFLDWYKMDVRNQRLVGMIILRAQTACGIVVPFFESSLQTFTTILRATGSYIALFRTFLE